MTPDLALARLCARKVNGWKRWIQRVRIALRHGMTAPGSRRLPPGDVTNAFAASRLYSCYQPIVALADGAPYALEVLARLDHPNIGRLFPSQFVPQIEDAGLAQRLTDRVINGALIDHRAMSATVAMDLSLNVPLDVLAGADFCDWIDRRREAFGVPAARLILELTESQPIADLDSGHFAALSHSMAALRQRGYRLAIDDFGPDTPQPLHVFDLPFDLLKLDMEAVQNTVHADLVRETILRCHRQGAAVVAEGIDHVSVWRRMQALGVEYGQGFLIGRPLDANHVAGWLAGGRKQGK